jgi:hypothetical protein
MILLVSGDGTAKSLLSAALFEEGSVISWIVHTGLLILCNSLRESASVCVTLETELLISLKGNSEALMCVWANEEEVTRQNHA